MSPATWRAWIKLQADLELAKSRLPNHQRDTALAEPGDTPLPAPKENSGGTESLLAVVSVSEVKASRMPPRFWQTGKLYRVVPWLPMVWGRPEAFWEPVRLWLEVQRREGKGVAPYGSRLRWRRTKSLPRWQWPPGPGEPVWGWRGRIVAEYTLKNTRNPVRRFRVQLPRALYRRLVSYSRGELNWSCAIMATVQKAVHARKAQKAAWGLAQQRTEHRAPMRVIMPRDGDGPGLGWR
jgi:hypothetical protein